jgi:hypothetical protein
MTRILISKILIPNSRINQLQNQNDQSRCRNFLCILDLINIRILRLKTLMPLRIDQDQDPDVEFLLRLKEIITLIDAKHATNYIFCIHNQVIDLF